MGDGIRNVSVLLLNGDGASYHLENIERTIRAIRAERPDAKVFIASPKKPSLPVEKAAPATRDGLGSLLDGLRSNIDDDDLLIISSTGHGRLGEDLSGTLLFEDGDLPLSDLSNLLSGLNPGRRVVIMDQCNGGGGLPFFQDEKTTVFTLGGPQEQTYCRDFVSTFWSTNTPDLDQDGVITIQERVQHLLSQKALRSHPQLFEPTIPVALSGTQDAKPDFAPLNTASEKQQLNGLLGKLRPGESAVILFSAPWCDACQKIKPAFRSIADQSHGHRLMIIAEAKSGKEDEWSDFHVQRWPTLLLITRNLSGEGFQTLHLSHPNDIPAGLKTAASNHSDQPFALYISGMGSEDLFKRRDAALALLRVGSDASAAVPQLLTNVALSKGQTQLDNLTLILEIGSISDKAATDIIEELNASDPEKRQGARRFLDWFLSAHAALGPMHYQKRKSPASASGGSWNAVLRMYESDAEKKKRLLHQMGYNFFASLDELVVTLKSASRNASASEIPRLTNIWINLSTCFPSVRPEAVSSLLKLHPAIPEATMTAIAAFLNPEDLLEPSHLMTFANVLGDAQTVTQGILLLKALSQKTDDTQGASLINGIVSAARKLPEARQQTIIEGLAGYLRKEKPDISVKMLFPFIEGSQESLATAALQGLYPKDLPWPQTHWKTHFVMDQMQSKSPQRKAEAVYQAMLLTVQNAEDRSMMLTLLQRMLDDQSVSVRRIAAFGLRNAIRHVDPTTADEIEAILARRVQDEDPIVRKAAISPPDDRERNIRIGLGTAYAVIDGSPGIGSELTLSTAMTEALELSARITGVHGLRGEADRVGVLALPQLTVMSNTSAELFVSFVGVGLGISKSDEEGLSGNLQLDPLGLGARLSLSDTVSLEASARSHIDFSLSDGEKQTGFVVPLVFEWQP